MKKPDKVRYEKPFLKKEKTMNFPIKILETHVNSHFGHDVGSGNKIVCKQCSECHGCR